MKLKNPLTRDITLARTYARAEDEMIRLLPSIQKRDLEYLRHWAGYTEEEDQLVETNWVVKEVSWPSGRLMFVGGSPASYIPEYYPGTYNCSSLVAKRYLDFERSFNNSFLGCGQGEGLYTDKLEKLDPILNSFNLTISGNFGDYKPGDLNYTENLKVYYSDFEEKRITIEIGDSRKAWKETISFLFEIYTKPDSIFTELDIIISSIRPYGTPIKGFGGVANPSYLPKFLKKIIKILNNAKGRTLNTHEAALIFNEGRAVAVSGNIRRSAGVNQFRKDDPSADLKMNLWIQDEEGNWKVDPERESLQYSNYTKVYFKKPSYEEILTAIDTQLLCGEGAIQYAPTAIARANIDLYKSEEDAIDDIVTHFENDTNFLEGVVFDQDEEINAKIIEHRRNTFHANPCFEVIGNEFYCNLASSHLAKIDNCYDLSEYHDAFRASTLMAVPLLKHKFEDPEFQFSREIDPIILVSFTEGFELFARLFGPRWCEWWLASPTTSNSGYKIKTGRPAYWLVELEEEDSVILENIKNGFSDILPSFLLEDLEDAINSYSKGYLTNLGGIFRSVEASIFSYWRSVVQDTLKDYCSRHNIKCPNRCTGLKPEGTGTLLTGYTAGWHPPIFGKYYIRRITVDPKTSVAKAALNQGFRIIPCSNSKASDGTLLNDIYDPDVINWLIEVPICIDSLPDDFDATKISALAQYDFWMQVQKYYTTHNTSATILVKQGEQEGLAKQIYLDIQDNEPYISVAMLPRSTDVFPRMPYEPCTKKQYEERLAEINLDMDFYEEVARLTSATESFTGPAACDSDFCVIK